MHKVSSANNDISEVELDLCEGREDGKYSCVSSVYISTQIDFILENYYLTVYTSIFSATAIEMASTMSLEHGMHI